MPRSCSRRTILQGLAAAAVVGGGPAARAQGALPAYSYPMGYPGRVLGDGLLIRHGYAVENIPYYPDWWHSGENWHAATGESAGLGVYAVAGGEVVFAGSDYPGRVVIVEHEDGLYAMYGHLDYALAVAEGERVARGQLLGIVLARGDDLARSHLHFELRTFFTADRINGEAPEYGVSCGYQCPPGPGYWPMGAAEHPSQLGWRNPTHVINRRAWPDGVPAGVSCVVSAAAPASTAAWPEPREAGGEALGEVALHAGERYPLLAIAAGPEDEIGTSAEAYRLWYRIDVGGEAAWVRAAVPLAEYAGSDGRPAAVRFNFLPEIATAGGE